MDVTDQIKIGKLVCPKTKQRLTIANSKQWLETTDKIGRYRYLRESIPILVSDPKWAEEYSSDSDRMNDEYESNTVAKRDRKSIGSRLKAKLFHDYRTESSKEAFLRLFKDLPSDSLCISIGGGPTRADPRLVNVNIGPFPNVDVVADAHCLPYADESVDLVHSDAVFEHLYNPVKAADEIYRVLKPGKRAYICTPFMQPYHGYPHHYYNYTISGHRHLFESAGFQVIEAGVCVGPAYTIINLMSVFLSQCSPRILKKPLHVLWLALTIPIRPLDKIMNGRQSAHVMASTTYLVVEKSKVNR